MGYVPVEYDPHIIYSRFFYFTLVNGKVRFGRFRDQVKHRMRVAFSNEISQLFGFGQFAAAAPGQLTWYTFERDPIAIQYAGDDISYGNTMHFSIERSKSEFDAQLAAIAKSLKMKIVGFRVVGRPLPKHGCRDAANPMDHVR